MSLEKANDNYLTGHSKKVLEFHAWRTVDNSVAYIKPYLQPHFKVLDVGCGPGTLSVDIAQRVPQGHVTGIEINQTVIDEATAHAKATGTTNIDFQLGDVFALPFPDATFDFVHVHQVIVHLQDPVAALREMYRVTKPGGYVAAREGDFGGMQWWPAHPAMDQWKEMRRRVSAVSGRGDADAGRKLHGWAHRAGFPRENINVTAGTWCFTKKEERDMLVAGFAARTLAEHVVKDYVDRGLATKEDLEKQAAAFAEWASDEDAWFVFLHGEIVCKK